MQLYLASVFYFATTFCSLICALTAPYLRFAMIDLQFFSLRVRFSILSLRDRSYFLDSATILNLTLSLSDEAYLPLRRYCTFASNHTKSV